MPQSSTGVSPTPSDKPATDPTKVRVGPVASLVQALSLAVIAYWQAFAVITSRFSFPYDILAWSIFFQLASAGVCVWIIQRRARAARTTIVICMLANAALALATSLLEPTWPERIPSPLPAIPSSLTIVVTLAIAAYFWFSPRMREVMTCSLERTREEREAQFEGARIADIRGGGMLSKPWQRWSWARNLIIHFAAFTLLGHWAEIAFCTLIRFGIVGGDYDPTNLMLWDEWLYPFLAEGYAIVFIVVILHPLKELLLDRFNGRRLPTLVLSFLANALVCTSIDFVTGITANADYHLWDYSNMPFNFMGQICLQNSLIYSTAATLIVWTIYPAMERLVHKPSESMMDGVFAGIAPFYLFLLLMYLTYLGPQGLMLG